MIYIVQHCMYLYVRCGGLHASFRRQSCNGSMGRMGRGLGSFRDTHQFCVVWPWRRRGACTSNGGGIGLPSATAQPGQQSDTLTSPSYLPAAAPVTLFRARYSCLSLVLRPTAYTNLRSFHIVVLFDQSYYQLLLFVLSFQRDSLSP